MKQTSTQMGGRWIIFLGVCAAVAAFVPDARNLMFAFFPIAILLWTWYTVRTNPSVTKEDKRRITKSFVMSALFGVAMFVIFVTHFLLNFGSIRGTMRGTSDMAKLAAAKRAVRALTQLVEAYHRDNGEYPSTAAGLNVLVRAPRGMKESERRKRHIVLDSSPLDPWGNRYRYELTENRFTILSDGPDKTPNTSDDIFSQNKPVGKKRAMPQPPKTQPQAPSPTLQIILPQDLTSLPDFPNLSIPSPAPNVKFNTLHTEREDDKALLLSGGQNRIETGLHYDGTHPITMEAWLKPRDLRGNRDVICDAQRAGTGIGFYDGRVTFFLHEGNGYLRIKARAKTMPGDEVHIAGVFDGNEIRLFVNGRLQQKQAFRGGSVKPSTMPITIGANPEANNHFIYGFEGLIDEVRISQVARYKEDFTPLRYFQSDDETMLLYHFDGEGSSNTTDASSHGRMGKITGALRVQLEG